MRKMPLWLYALFFLGSHVCAQSGSFPPVTFSPGDNVCDTASWKLVFYDGFDGTDLDRTKWHSYNVWNGYEGEDWGEGRYSNGIGFGNSIHPDKNVVVSNGTCKLIQMRESTDWKCNTCSMSPVHMEYTAGLIETYYSNHFNAGKFEARIKFPTFKNAHCDFWLWTGKYINSIDIAEAYGDPFWPYGINNGNNRYVDHELHAMKPEAASPYAAYNVRDDRMGRYPNQTWWDHLFGSWFDQTAWHVYTVEWDTAVIKFYLDQSLVRVEWKYYQNHYVRHWPFVYKNRAGSGCSPDGTCKVATYFPYDAESECNIRLQVGIDRDAFDAGTYYIGQMEVDYVKVWQRDPSKDHHVEICKTPPMTITGPDIVCDQAAYTVSPAVAGGTWQVAGSDALSLAGVSYTPPTGTATFLQHKDASRETAVIEYRYAIPGCPDAVAAKKVDVGAKKNAYVTCVKSNYGNQHQFSLAALSPLGETSTSPTTYEWFVHYAGRNDCLYPDTYHASGQYITTPSYPAGTAFCISWTVRITNDCGTKTFSGLKKGGAGKFLPEPGDEALTHDPGDSAFYFEADMADAGAYEQAVADRVELTYFKDLSDTAAVHDLIGQIRLEELGPYLAAEGWIAGGRSKNQSAEDRQTRIFPVPATDFLRILPGGSFDANEAIRVSFYDLGGRLLSAETVHATSSNGILIQISNLPGAVYHMELSQRQTKEHHRFIKY